MANDNLKDRLYLHNGQKESYTALAMKESRLKEAKDDCENNRGCQEFERLGGQTELEKIETMLKTIEEVEKPDSIFKKALNL